MIILGIRVRQLDANETVRLRHQVPAMIAIDFAFLVSTCMGNFRYKCIEHQFLDAFRQYILADSKRRNSDRRLIGQSGNLEMV